MTHVVRCDRCSSEIVEGAWFAVGDLPDGWVAMRDLCGRCMTFLNEWRLGRRGNLPGVIDLSQVRARLRRGGADRKAAEKQAKAKEPKN